MHKTCRYDSASPMATDCYFPALSRTSVHRPYLFGDYNNNGRVDAADYVVWRKRIGPGSLPNENPTQSPGSVDAADYHGMAGELRQLRFRKLGVNRIGSRACDVVCSSSVARRFALCKNSMDCIARLQRLLSLRLSPDRWHRHPWRLLRMPFTYSAIILRRSKMAPPMWKWDRAPERTFPVLRSIISAVCRC